MIKFFRKIRYKLVETGKTGKYFKYAIGENILVMIGILLALQVNTLNEQKKEYNTAIVLAKSLVEDLNKDAKFLTCKNCRKKFTQTTHKKKKSLPICPYCGTHNN